MSVSLHRRLLTLSLIGLFTISACEAKKMPKTVVLDMVVFSYLPRPIFDVYLNGKGGDSSFVYPETGGSTITGVVVPLGSQKVSWRLGGPEGMVGNGDRVEAANVLPLVSVSDSAKFIAVHIYQDSTVELIATQHYPRPTERGVREGEQARRLYERR